MSKNTPAMTIKRTSRATLHPYEATTRGIRIRVEPHYMEEQSSPEDSHFVWSYAVEIINDGTETVQLRSRIWRITDALGRTEEVRGPGVVGQTPVIAPGKSFHYTSGCPLKTPQGIMVGSYQMTDDAGELFDVAIPAFSLDSPYTRRSMN
ncbi:MAG TPA: Co2+/Mg2+ efflux protein ApaG [Hyphomicrobium sp.]|jgi:ApaG protein|uniref:Co2+/Mg2+ efflux protein ApaG n=1 Tax=Hyphomicrobium sp. TaxID=82 RepID=UPI002C28CD53|nr:Co2+/Mg2+ efflux protein ApaG [Hyphomicrobium sp.]HXE02726.1 Co2+/Mg2+ efflux protein ApaG [Hyphomicrobium sp.]